MKRFKLLEIISTALVILTVLAGCASMQLVSVEADTVEGPKQVRQGKEINPSSVTVWGTYKDGSRKKVSNIRAGNIVFDSHAVGPQSVRVIVSKGHEVTFQTEVMALLSLTVASLPTAEFFTGEAPDTSWSGLEIRGEWDQMGGGIIDTASCEITGFNIEQAGRQTLTVAHEGKTATFSINVAPASPFNGTWDGPFTPGQGGQVRIFTNKGTYETAHSGQSYTRSFQGTYTLSDGKITLTPTHAWTTLTAGFLPAGWLTQEQIMEQKKRVIEQQEKAVAEGKTVQPSPVLSFNPSFQPTTLDYSVNGGTLILGDVTYTKRQ